MSKHEEFPTKPDYEAKYKHLEQAVKDAIQEMQKTENEMLKQYHVIYDSYYYGESIALKNAISNLHIKTGITA